jgi:hypothetical protein
MSRENKGKPPRPQLRQPRFDQLKLPRFPVDPLVEAIGRRVLEETEQEQTPEPPSVKEPMNEPTVTQSSGKRKSGPRRTEWPHLAEALDALGKKWPDITQVEAKHVKFLVKHLRNKGDDVAYELTEAGEKVELQARTVRRRIEEWLETRKGNLSR